MIKWEKSFRISRLSCVTRARSVHCHRVLLLSAFNIYIYLYTYIYICLLQWIGSRWRLAQVLTCFLHGRGSRTDGTCIYIYSVLLFWRLRFSGNRVICSVARWLFFCITYVLNLHAHGGYFYIYIYACR